MQPKQVALWSELQPLTPTWALVEGVDLVIVRWEDEDTVSVLYGRCLHRGALLADGRIEGQDLVCGLHGWDYRYDTGINEYHHSEVLEKFTAWVEDGAVWVDADEIATWVSTNPQPYDRDSYQGTYQIPMSLLRSRMSGLSASWRAMGSREAATTAPSLPWVSNATRCRPGTRFSCSPRS